MMGLPTGWTATNLRAVADWSSGGTPSRKRAEFFGGDIPWVKTGELTTKYIRETHETLTELGVKNSSARIFPKGSVGIAMYGATIGKVSIWGIEASTNQACAVAQPVDGVVTSEFLYHFLRAERNSLVREGKGGAQPNISQGLLKEWPIALPPLNEQHRIVERIEVLFDEIDRGIESLRDAKRAIGLYRQSLLKSAFEGHLTADWRAKNPDKLESPDALLARIRTEREMRYQAALDEWKEATVEWHANGEQDKRPAKPRPPKSAQVVSSHRLAVPTNWSTVPFRGIVFESVLGKMLDRQKNRGQPRVYLGNVNLRWGSFNLDSRKKIPIEDKEVGRYGVRKGDLIICEGGEPGRCAVWDGDDDQVFIQKALHRVRFTASYSPEFAYFFFRFAATAGFLDEHYTGSTIKHLTGAALGDVLVPVCPPAEQAEVVRILDAHLEAMDTLNKEIDANLTRAESLRQSILKQAFSGKLVPQDPNDEPAKALLARIRAHRQD